MRFFQASPSASIFKVRAECDGMVMSNDSVFCIMRGRASLVGKSE